MMGEMAKKIVINDLLSFLTCKNHLAPREKLLNTISEYYSEEAIAEAQRALLSALPVKKSTRHGRRVKHPDPLVVIYDCIQLIPKDDLPIFVCKNLNNVPNLNNIKEMTLKMEEEENFEDQAVDEAEAESNDNEIDEALWRKEQKLMRSQISEMFSIITELRDGLHRYYTQNKRIGPKTEIIENKRTSKNGNYYSESESNPVISKFQSAEDESCNQSDSDDDTSELDGLALLQKLIDEDDQNIEMDTVDKEDSYNSEEDPGNRDEFDMKENLGTSDYPQMEVNKTENYAKLSQSSVKGVSLPSKKPTVVVTPSENGHKVIYIRSDLEERGANSAGVDAPPLNSDMETPIEISTTSDYISQIEIGATSHPSHQDQKLYGDEDVNLSSGIKTEEFDACELEVSQKKKRNGYCCHYCMESFTVYKMLRMHMTSHCVVKNVSCCVLCRAKFMDRNALKDHFVTCFERCKVKYKKNMCMVCKTFYASDKALKQHKNLHEEFRPHSCPHCPYKYLNKATLDAHVKNQHSPLNKFICPFCSHSAITNAYLSKHIKVHTGETPFVCRTCGHKVKTKFLLKRHIELHGPLRERKCDKCSFVCVGLNEYLRHRRKVHGKPIICQICRQTFKQSSTFVRHYNLHTQKKPYKCDQCLYTATAKETLRLHKLTHSGPNVQLCPDCYVSCRNKRNLRRHRELYCTSLSKEKK